MATFYASRFAGRRTASGERYDPGALTAAHRTLPLGTVVRVTRVDGSGGAVLVRINDRGPYASGRIIDLSLAAARRLQMLQAGVVRVRLEVVSRP
jgi:rare lipoprotein A